MSLPVSGVGATPQTIVHLCFPISENLHFDVDLRTGSFKALMLNIQPSSFHDLRNENSSKDTTIYKEQACFVGLFQNLHVGIRTKTKGGQTPAVSIGRRTTPPRDLSEDRSEVVSPPWTGIAVFIDYLSVLTSSLFPKQSFASTVLRFYRTMPLLSVLVVSILKLVAAGVAMTSNNDPETLFFRIWPRLAIKTCAGNNVASLGWNFKSG